MTALGLMKTVKKADGTCSFVFGNLSNIQVETGLIVFGQAKWVQLDMTDQLDQRGMTKVSIIETGEFYNKEQMTGQSNNGRSPIVLTIMGGIFDQFGNTRRYQISVEQLINLATWQ